MNKLARFVLGSTLTCLALCGTASAFTEPVAEEPVAEIEGVYYSLMLSPAIKEKCPDLTAFNIVGVGGSHANVISKSEAVVGPGQCTLIVEVKTRQHGSTTLTLTFEATAGCKYLLRPVYRGNTVAATVQNASTGEFVARTWLPAKRKTPTEPSSRITRPAIVRNFVFSTEISRIQLHVT